MAESTAKSEQSTDRRSGSPFHQKCVPPFCDSAQTDRFVVAKLQREELEDRYIVVCDENLKLKRSLNELRKQVQRLSTQAQRQERINKREGRNVPYCEEESSSLQQQNRMLMAKVNVLTQQLKSHSRMHVRVHGSANAKEAAGLSPTRRPELTPEKELKSMQEVSTIGPTGSEIDQLKYRIVILEQELNRQREAYERRIAELEAESPPSFPRNVEAEGNDEDRVMDNVELIRLRRLSKKQEAQLNALTDHVDAADKELALLRKTVEQLNLEEAELTQKLQKEKEKFQTAQHEAVQNKSQVEAVKALEEQVLDLQKERATLKDYNEKLLALTSQQVANESQLKNKIELLEDKLKQLESEQKNLASSNTDDIIELLDWKKDNIEPELNTVSDRSNPDASEMEHKEEFKEIQDTENVKTDLNLPSENDMEHEEEFTEIQDTENVKSDLNLSSENDSQVKPLHDIAANVLENTRKRSIEEDTSDFVRLKKERSVEYLSSNEDMFHSKPQLNKQSSKSLMKCSCRCNPNDEEVMILKENVRDLENKLKKNQRNDHNQCICDALEVSDALKQGHENSDGLEKKLESVLEEIITLRKLLKEAKSRIKNSICKCNDSSQTKEVLTGDKDAGTSDHIIQAINEEPVESNDTIVPFNIYRTHTEESIKHVIIKGPKHDDVELQDRSVGESNILSYKDLKTRTVEPITTIQSKPDEISTTWEEFKSMETVTTGEEYKSKEAVTTGEEYKSKETVTTGEEYKSKEALSTVIKDKPLVKKAPPKRICCTKRPLIAMKKRNKRKRKKVTEQTTITKIQSPTTDFQEEYSHENEKQMKSHNYGTYNFFEERIPTKVIDKTFEHTSETAAPVQPINEPLSRSPTQQRHIEYEETDTVDSDKHRREGGEKLKHENETVKCEGSEEYFNPEPFINKIEVITSISRELKPSKLKRKTNLCSFGRKPKPNLIGDTNRDIFVESRTIISKKRNKYDGASLEICMISIKVDHVSYKNLTNLDSDPHIYLTWELLGVKKRTRPIKPLRKVDFKNCVVYYGLISKPILQHAFDHCIDVVCYLLKEDGTSIFIADGQLELSSTLGNPGVIVYRYIDLIGNGVQIELYCSFRLSNSNQTQSPFSELPVKGKQEFPSSMKTISYFSTSSPYYMSEDSKQANSYHEEACNICDKKEKHRHRLSAERGEDEQNNLIVKIEALKLNKNLLEDRNVSQLYVEYLFLGLRGQEMETKCLPKDRVMSFHYSKDFTHEVKTNKTVRHKLRKMLKSENQQVLRFLIVSEPLSKEEDVKECVEMGFAQVNLYTSMLLKKKNIVKEKLPVFSMDGKLNCGALVVSVLGIDFMIDVMKGSGSSL